MSRKRRPRINLLLAAALAVYAFGQTPQFEVASVKRSGPPPTDRTAGRVAGFTVDNARLDIRQLNVAELVHRAWAVPRFTIVVPGSMRMMRFDISAKLPDGATAEQVLPMLRALLSDRLHLQFHAEKREMPVYALLVAKGGPNFKPAGPDAVASPDATSAKSTTDRYGEIEHMDFPALNSAGLAEAFVPLVDRPVVDHTNLTGRYHVEFDINLREFRTLQSPQHASPGAASEPTGKLSVFQTAERLGLKLEPRKESVDMIVVDHIDETPTEN